MDKKNCKHKEVQYDPAINEDGWLCLDCKEKLGFRPDLDRRETHYKVLSILNILHNNEIVQQASPSHVFLHFDSAFLAREQGTFQTGAKERD